MHSDDQIAHEPVNEAEKMCFHRIMNAFKAYKPHLLKRINQSTSYINAMDEDSRRYLKKYSQHLENVKVCVDVNNEFLHKIVEDANIFEQHNFMSVANSADKNLLPTPMDMDKVLSTLRQFAREWSADGEVERNQCFLPLLERAEKYYPKDRSNVKVLVPGAGLGRLAYEFAARGFCCEGNEFSFHMLASSFYILNKCKEANQFKIYPYASHFSNNFRNADQIRGVLIPDVQAGGADIDSMFSMTAGDFTEVYADQPEQWDIVCTCFFIDTAHNVVEYLLLIYRILKPGGYWLNLGPLLYHFSDMTNENSVEPSLEDIKNIAKAIGFDIVEELDNVKTSYCNTPAAMLQYVYNSALLVCQKPPLPASTESSASSS